MRFTASSLRRVLACSGVFVLASAAGGQPGPAAVVATPPAWRIVPAGETVTLTAGLLSRTLDFTGGNASTTGMKIDGRDSLAGPAREFSVTITCAEPNRRPRGLSEASAPPIRTTAHFAPNADAIRLGPDHDSGVRWRDPVRVEASTWSAGFEVTDRRVTQPTAATQRLTVQARARKETAWEGLELNLCYEIYPGYPVIRKWVELVQRGPRWLKLEQLTIDDLELAPSCRQRTLLTPDERGAGSSVVAFGHPDGEYGVVAVSEVPSALRRIHETGAMGYADQWFEWVLGPGETFVSEPVFYYAWQGARTPTNSAISTPLDRALEGPYLDFLRQHVGVAADARIIAAPQWCSWTHFKENLSDGLMRELAAIAARCGFALMLLDAGWQVGALGTDPDPIKFPDFAATCQALRAQGLEIGLWVSCYRRDGAADLQAMPAARNLPLITRDGGFGMSFASPWRTFYAEDLAEVSRRYGVRYFKQDFTNLKFGDVAEGHESRTRKESLLRALRGLLAAQDRLRELRPEVTAEITHEIYWGTPGVPCDVAALKHVGAYHIPPNDYAGAGPTTGRVRPDRPVDVAKLQEQLRAGAWHARQRLYAHRGLPLYPLEYYAAHAVNLGGSLTPALQDRQICSWLMGVPAVFAGDLASLTPENVTHYRRRFDLVKRLERDFGIYRRFQFSGVPAPTDEDWHWWGKLNAEGGGAVVVLRGNGGADERAVNIPWVQGDRTYQVHAQLRDKPLGKFTGRQLQAGALRLALPALGQEILEVRSAQ
jgi:hypothetical protein